MSEFPHKYVMAGICAVGGFHLLLRVLPDGAGDLLASAVAAGIPAVLLANQLLHHGTLNILEGAAFFVLEWISVLKESRLRRQAELDARRAELSIMDGRRRALTSMDQQRSQHA